MFLYCLSKKATTVTYIKEDNSILQSAYDRYHIKIFIFGIMYSSDPKWAVSPCGTDRYKIVYVMYFRFDARHAIEPFG